MLVAQTGFDITVEQVIQIAFTIGLILVGGTIYTLYVNWKDAQPQKRQRATAGHSGGRQASAPPLARQVEAAPVVQPAPTPPIQQPVAPAMQVPRVELAVLADALNVAIIGPKGSGKTTLISRLLSLRAGYVEALDPHSEPNKWPCTVVGGGEQFDVIHTHLLAAYNTMRERYAVSARGERTQAEYQTPIWSVTLAGDEFGGIVGELPDMRATKDRQAVMGAGSLLGKLLARGRKVGLGVITATHDDTAAQFGLEGEYGLLQCFDWLVYLGGAATSNTTIPIETRQAARRMQRPAVALDTEHHEWYLLDTRSALNAPSYTTWLMPEDYALRVNLDTPVSKTGDILTVPTVSSQSPRDIEGTPPESEGTARDMRTDVSVTPAEVAQIAVSLSRGLTVNQAAKAMRGYNGRTRPMLMAKVEYVKSLLDVQSPSTSEDEPVEGEVTTTQQTARAA